MRGRWLVLGMVAVGVVLAFVASRLRGRGEPRLPLRPGTIVLLTMERGAVDLGPLAAGAIEFKKTHGVTRDAVASLGAIVTGRMPREEGLVREGGAIARAVPVLGELLGESGFVGAAFTARHEPLFPSGVLRGCTTIVEGGGADGAKTLERAGDWLLSRGTAPSFCHVHLGASAADGAATAGEGATAPFFARLRDAGIDARAAIVAISLRDPSAPTLSLHLPPGLLPASVAEHEVSLLDVVPSLIEVFGSNGRAELMEPFLLGPRTNAPRFFLFTDPLAPPPPDFEGCDAVTLLAGGRHWSLDPRASPAEQSDDPAARNELRRILESAWGYRIESAGGTERARFLNR